jgi:hypothetical protein
MILLEIAAAIFIGWFALTTALPILLTAVYWAMYIIIYPFVYLLAMVAVPKYKPVNVPKKTNVFTWIYDVFNSDEW